MNGRVFFCNWINLLTVLSLTIGSIAVADELNALYSIKQIDAQSLQLEAPILPDISKYDAQWIPQQVPSIRKGRISTPVMHKEPSLLKFLENDQMRKWVKKQSRLPLAIKLESGRITLPMLLKLVDNPTLLSQEENIYTLHVPLVIDTGATLIIQGNEVNALRLSEEGGAFIVNIGDIFFLDTELTSWNHELQSPSPFSGKKHFRPFYLAWNNSKSYFSNTDVVSLGYASSKSYGFSLSYNHKLTEAGYPDVRPIGWLFDSRFIDMYYGFYSYEADDVVILRNTYIDNIVYGIDPHDRSNRLIIAYNEAYGTKEKHGIIISREVNDSWVFNNFSHHNNGSGFMIDRSSVRNIFAHNLSIENGDDGFAVYESPDNLLWSNKALNNKRHGVQIRNSTDIRVYNNVLADNHKYGVFGHIKVEFPEYRDLELDPFIADVSITVASTKLLSNHTGAIAIDAPYEIQLYDLDLRFPYKQKGTYFRGVLDTYHNVLFDILYRQRGAVAVIPITAEKAQAIEGGI
ncbi:carbohydrate-binding and sugar hydrolysis protein [Oleiphilus messinensis]|uniref:Carbohydrate-binding and sugar hydrolysis protein n=1 Tax=Oleiphilus messinensis TaxID=141451 RepID=A0A1Y0ID70_9GAMM|nr:right-handed parallel beta-helix repeat-containing protein [Oleiphilus messinensis]ARU58478.1 carbohydrate-binding and sugar hydrolysis protein [Oleiphilus messinensis]